jgi:hypothetical protein
MLIPIWMRREKGEVWICGEFVEVIMSEKERRL